MKIKCLPSDQSCEILTIWVVPILTAVLTNLNAFIPFFRVRKCIIYQNIGSLNPIPFAWISLISLTTMIYGLFRKDMFIFLSSISGYFLGLYYTFSLYDLALQQYRKWVKLSMLIGNFVLFLFAFLAFIVFNSSTNTGFNTKQQTTMGIGNSIMLISFYLSPFSTIYEVIKTKNSQTIFAPFVVCGFFSSSSWVIYGFILDDLFLIIPNSIACLCSFLQVICFIVLKKPETQVVDVENLNTSETIIEVTPVSSPRSPRPPQQNILPSTEIEMIEIDLNK